MRTYENCRYGTLRCPQDAYIGAALEHYGEYSQIEADFLCSLLKPGDAVVEAGAHVGTLTMAMARAIGIGAGQRGHIWAYEPQEELFAALIENVPELSGWAVEMALGAKVGFLGYNPNPGNTGGVELSDDGNETAAVTTLDSKTGLDSIGRLDLFKIDVEGMERDVLEGATETIGRCRPIIYCENDRPEKSRALFDKLFALGYRVWRHEPPLFNPDNWRKQPINIWPNVCSMNLVCITAEREPPEQVKGLIEVKHDQWAAVCRFGGVGDNLIAAAVIPDLVRQGNRVEVITSVHAGCVFEYNPYVSKLSICHDGDQPGDGGIEWQKWFDRRAHEYAGGLFHLSHTVETTLALVQAQTAFWWPDRVRRHLCHKSYLEMGADICGGSYAFGPLFYASAAEKARAAETKAKMGEKVIAWVLCGSRFDKVYPYSGLTIARLIRELDVPVMMIGAPGKDFELAKAIQVEVQKHNGDDKGLHLAMSPDGANPSWPIRRSLAQAIACDLVIGPDTGIMWGAAFEPMPKMMLLSHASPENITKHWRNTVALAADQARVPCWPCHRLHDVIDTCHLNADKTGVACISDITVEIIVKTARAALLP